MAAVSRLPGGAVLVKLSELPPGDYEFDDAGELRRQYAPSPTLDKAKRKLQCATDNFVASGNNLYDPDDTPALHRLLRAQHEVAEIENDLAALEDLEYDEEDEEVI